MLQIPEFLKLLFFTKSHKCKKHGQLEGYSGRQCVLKISNRVPLRHGCAPDPIPWEIITPSCGPTMLWLLSVLSLQQFLRWKLKHVFILKSYLSWTIETSFQNNIPMKKTFLHHPARHTLEQPSARQLPRLLGKPKHPILAGALTVFNWMLSPDSLSK